MPASRPDVRSVIATKTRLFHIARATVPWRDDELTECGRPLAGLPVVITRADYLERNPANPGRYQLLADGCRVCQETAIKYRSWSAKPTDVLARACETELFVRTARVGSFGRLDQELLALAALVDRHRDEYRLLLDLVERGLPPILADDPRVSEASRRLATITAELTRP